MRHYKKLFITIFILLASTASFAQQNPSSIDWKYIDAGHYRIIFPDGLEDRAQRTAKLMLFYEKFNYRSLSTEPRYIPIVIINDYCDANGFVSPAPFYSHWFTTPSSFASIDWFTALAIHEGRHMVQFNRFREGNKFLWYIAGGNYGSTVFMGLFIPPWFLEGDAVVMETALTKGGRGRLPSFNLWYRGMVLSGKDYSYYRSYLGTYDDCYPDASSYSLGYIICSYVRLHYGVKAWDRIIESTGSGCLFFTTFDGAVENETGRNIREIYSDAMAEYAQLWNNSIEGITFTGSELLSPDHDSTWESYIFPFSGSDNTYALRFSRKKTLTLVKMFPGGKIENIRMMPFDALTPFMSGERGISAGGDYILWRETDPDARWGYRTWSNLVLYSLSTGDEYELTGNGKFIASAISPGGNIAAGIEYTAADGYTLRIFNTGTRSEVSSVKLNDYGHLFDPAVSHDNSRIALAAVHEKGTAILVYDIQSGKVSGITGYTTLEHFRSPVFYGKYIFYVSDYTGIDNIYAIDTETGKRWQVSSVRLGAYFPAVSVKDNKLIFSEYTASGYRAVSMDIDNAQWVPFDKLRAFRDPYVQAITDQEQDPDMKSPDTPGGTDYAVNDYNTLTDGMAIAGWYPFFDSGSSDFSFNIIFQDVLQTLNVQAGYIYNKNENSHAGYGTLQYSGLYPVFTFTGSYGSRAVKLDRDEAEPGTDRFISWNETLAECGVSLPLNFSGGIHNVYLTVGASAGIIRITDKNHEDWSIYNDMNRDGDLEYASYSLEFSHTITGALNARIPRFGEVLSVSYTHTPLRSDYEGSLFSSGLTVYLPSIWDTHGFKFQGVYEYYDYENYVFSRRFLFPRGYDSVTCRHIVSGSADYMFPIADFSLPIWKLVYFKRLNGSLFADYGAGFQDGVRKNFRSAGVELTLVQNVLSNPYLLFEAGVRYARCFDTNENRWEMLLTVPVY